MLTRNEHTHPINSEKTVQMLKTTTFIENSSLTNISKCQIPPLTFTQAQLLSFHHRCIHFEILCTAKISCEATLALFSIPLLSQVPLFRALSPVVNNLLRNC